MGWGERPAVGKSAEGVSRGCEVNLTLGEDSGYGEGRVGQCFDMPVAGEVAAVVEVEA